VFDVRSCFWLFAAACLTWGGGQLSWGLVCGTKGARRLIDSCVCAHVRPAAPDCAAIS